MSDRDLNPPERIYLLVGEPEVGGAIDPFYGEATWHYERLEDTDVEYVRADRIAVLRAEVERYRTALAATQVALDIHWLDEVTGSSAEAYGIVRDALKPPSDEEVQ